VEPIEDSLEFVFGGTFDPVHNGHIAIIKALNQLAPQYPVRLIPCFVPALKAEPTSSFKQRIEMLSMAVESIPNIIIDQRESTREGASFMVDTLQSLAQQYPQKTFILVMGADSALELTRWHQWQRLSSLCHLLVLNRPGISQLLINSAVSKSLFKLCEGFQNLEKAQSGMSYLLKMPEKAESSTQIRQFRDNNLELDSLLPQSVIKYITSHQLY
jgi:nicotinate-nucleotide adenylyltransferase